MTLIFCERCEHWHLEEILIPNKQTGMPDVYCETCLPDEHRPALEEFRKQEAEKQLEEEQ